MEVVQRLFKLYDAVLKCKNTFPRTQYNTTLLDMNAQTLRVTFKSSKLKLSRSLIFPDLSVSRFLGLMQIDRRKEKMK